MTTKKAPKTPPQPAAKLAPDTEPTHCERCAKPLEICVCDNIKPQKVGLHVVVLQHPQEQDRVIGTVPLLEAAFGKQVTRVIGLSWPSLSAALGGKDIDRDRYAMLYPIARKKPLPPSLLKQTAVVVDKSGNHIAKPKLKGIVVLDGSWSQAKTLWWRNAWVLKHPAILLHPREPSLYGKLRKEPRREYVSTLEAVADCLVGLGEEEAVRTELRRSFRTLLQRARDARVTD